MAVYRVIDKMKLSELLPLLSHLPDDMKVEVSGMRIQAETKGDLCTAESLPFPFLMQVPRKPYPDSSVKIVPVD